MGQWDGQRIVSEEWSTAPTGSDESAGSAWDYQRMWWRVAKERSDFLAGGHLVRFLYLNPLDRIVIVRLGKSRGGLSRTDWGNVFVSLLDRLR
jgi:CubicO group peptidase (beta-lactamase class C family)